MRRHAVDPNRASSPDWFKIIRDGNSDLLQLEVCLEGLIRGEGKGQSVAAGLRRRCPVVDVLVGRGVVAEAGTAGGCRVDEFIRRAAGKSVASRGFVSDG